MEWNEVGFVYNLKKISISISISIFDLSEIFIAIASSMLQFAVGLVLVGLVLAYGLRWLWWPSKARRISPKGKAFVVTGAASGFGKEGS